MDSKRKARLKEEREKAEQERTGRKSFRERKESKPGPTKGRREEK